MALTTWSNELAEQFQKLGDSWENVEHAIPPLDDWVYKAIFESGFKAFEQGKPFIIWTESYIYFPMGYDSCEWVDYVPRHPKLDYIPHHKGGG